MKNQTETTEKVVTLAEVLDRANAPELMKILNREGFATNRLLYKRVREETGKESAGNHNALSIKDALIEVGGVVLPKVAKEALVMSSILKKYNVKAISAEIVEHLTSLGFTEEKDEDTKEVFYMRPWTGKIFSRYEEPKDTAKAIKAVKAPKTTEEKAKNAAKAPTKAPAVEKAPILVQKKTETFSTKEMAARYGVKQFEKRHKEKAAKEGFVSTKAEKHPFAVTYSREVAV